MPERTITVVKLGGALLEGAEQRARCVATLAHVHGQLIVVHGGGREATVLAGKLGVPTRLVDGRRITDAAMLDIVAMVYGGRVNRTLVAALQAAGRDALGLTGADADVVRARRRPVQDVDYGLVGDITRVNARRLLAFLEAGLTPVLAPLTHDGDGGLLNTNADTLAASVAAACAAHADVRLLFCLDRKGVLDDIGETLPAIDEERAAELGAGGIVSAGMLPKLHSAFAALRGGVRRVRICHADDLARADREERGPWTEVLL